MSNMSSICDKNHTWGIGRLFGKRLEGYGFKNRGGMRRVCFSALLAPDSRKSRGDPMKYLHTMVRVTDIEQSLRFYRDALGLRELSRKDYTQGRYTLVFLAAPGDEDAQVELTHNWDPEEYSSGRRTGCRSSCCRKGRRCPLRSPGPSYRMSGSGSYGIGAGLRCATPQSEHFGGVRRLDLDLRSRRDVLARDHLVVALSRTHHGIDAGVTIDHDLEKGRSLESDELLDHARHVRFLIESYGIFEAVRHRRLDEILGMQALVAGAQAALVKQLLPLLNHAVAEVIEHDHLDRQIVSGDRLQLADIHADAGIAVDINNQTIALRELGADCRRQSEAHGAHAARGQPQPRTAEVEVLRRPHLVLADPRGDDGFALGEPVDFLDDVVGLNELAVAGVIHRVLHAQRVAVPMPRRPIALETAATAGLEQGAQRLRQHAHVTPIDALDLADFRSIDVEMRNELGLAGEFGRIAGDTIVEARAKRQQAIAIVHRVVGKGGAMHAQHAHRQRMRGVDGTDSHQGGDHRNLKLSGKFA